MISILTFSFKPHLKILSFAKSNCFLDIVIQSSLTSYFLPKYSAKPPQPHPISKTLSPLLGLIKSINFWYLLFWASDKSLFFTVDASETDRLKNSGYKFNKTGFDIGTRFEY